MTTRERLHSRNDSGLVDEIAFFLFFLLDVFDIFSVTSDASRR